MISIDNYNPVTEVIDIPEPLLSDLRDLMEACGPNKHDRAVIAIEALIEEGINRGPALVAAGIALGFNGKHFGKLLDEGKGTNPERHRWRRSDDGIYSLLH